LSLNQVAPKVGTEEKGQVVEEAQVVDLIGGADGNRTHDLLNAIQALSQLSYGPTTRED
jgi:hypothetical protein